MYLHGPGCHVYFIKAQHFIQSCINEIRLAFNVFFITYRHTYLMRLVLYFSVVRGLVGILF